MLVWLHGKPHLLDPGYLIVRPLLLPTHGEILVPTSFNRLILTSEKHGTRIALATAQDNQTTYRLTFKTTPVDAGEFLRAWDVSFDADMMRYLVLSRVVGGEQIYFQKRHLLTRGVETRRIEIAPDQLIAEIARQFHIAPAVIAKALDALKRKGKPHGGHDDA
jgi:hypothetical protein